MTVDVLLMMRMQVQFSEGQWGLFSIAADKNRTVGLGVPSPSRDLLSPFNLRTGAFEHSPSTPFQPQDMSPWNEYDKGG